MTDGMFEASNYGPEVAAILDLGDGGRRRMPLAIAGCTSAEAQRRLAQHSASRLFPQARSPEGALAGLYLYFGCFDDSHRLSQDLSSTEGSYWHGILHRQEPDAGNAAYWFRRVGDHPVFPQLARTAGPEFETMYGGPAPFIKGNRWDPFGFIDFCEAARRGSKPREAEAAMQVQLIEWQLLFDYCAAPRS
jgi:hypothetical protein